VKGLNFFNRLVYFFNLCFGLLLLLTCIAPYVPAGLVSFLPFLSLIVPYLVLVNVLFLIYWLLKRNKRFLISTVILFLGYVVQGTFVKFFNTNSVTDKGEISILTFNSHNSYGERWARNPSFGNEIVDFVTSQNADIVCLQEFDHKEARNLEQYTYRYVNYVFSKEEKRVTQAIFSKYPILSEGSLDFPKSLNNAIYADILIKADTIRIYNLHLESLKFRAGSIKREAPDRLFKRLSKSIAKQQEQAGLVVTHSKGIRHRKIICGDFNTTQFSSIYNTIKGEMNDSFLENRNKIP